MDDPTVPHLLWRAIGVIFVLFIIRKLWQSYHVSRATPTSPTTTHTQIRSGVGVSRVVPSPSPPANQEHIIAPKPQASKPASSSSTEKDVSQSLPAQTNPKFGSTPEERHAMLQQRKQMILQKARDHYLHTYTQSST